MLLAAVLMTAALGDFPLESGEVLKDLKLTYRTYGALNLRRDNAVVFPTWFNGTTAQLEAYLTGADPLVDSSQFFIVAVDAIGNGFSSSPSNAAPSQRGKAFPAFTIGDMVRAQHLLLSTVFNLGRLHAVIGISMGGMQAFEWMARYPESISKGVSIVGTPRMSGADFALWIQMGAEQAEKASKTRRGGHGGAWPDLLGPLLRLGTGGFFVPRPENALAQFHALRRHDSAARFGGIAGLANNVRADVLIFVAENDQAVAEAAPAEFARLHGARFIRLTGPGGHNAYKTERQLIARETAAFLLQPPQQRATYRRPRLLPPGPR